MKSGKYFLAGIMLLSLNLSFLSALELEVNQNKYDISALFIDQNHAKINVSNQVGLSLSKETPPYQIYDAYKVGGIYAYMSYISYDGFSGGSNEAAFSLGFEEKINYTKSIKMAIDNADYNISLENIESNSLVLKVSNGTAHSITQSCHAGGFPYNLYGSYTCDTIGFYFVIKNIVFSNQSNGTKEANIYVFFKTNLSERCIENWNCSEWGSCSSNIQKRSCAEKNGCWDPRNKPNENQSCNSSLIAEVLPLVSCQNDCYMPGEKICTESYGYRICNYTQNNDSCLKFGPTISCGANETCSSGNCIKKEEPKPQCSLVGFRQKGEYCSFDGKFLAQRISGEACENDFECQSNVCESSICSKANDNKKLIYAAVIGAIIAIILLVSHKLISKKRHEPTMSQFRLS